MMGERPQREYLMFKMGCYVSRYPTDRLYARNHMWAEARGAGLYRFGFTAYAARLMQDVYFLDWIVAPGARLEERQEIGAIESKKAESDLYAPIAGVLARLNEELLDDPSWINVDHYGRGWLLEIEGDGRSLLTPQQYLARLERSWPVTERTIKAKLNDLD